MVQKAVALLVISFILLGAGHPHRVIHEGGGQVARNENENVTIQFEEKSETKKNVAGVPLLTVESKVPIVKIKGNEVASSKINTYYDGVKKEFQAKVQEFLDYAEENYGSRPNEDLQYWNSYALGLSYSPARVDDKVVSLVRAYYEFAGGAHPNSLKYAENFSVDTGEKLTLKDITKDEVEARTEINDYILKLTQGEAYKGYFFEGYEKDLPKILEENTWYFSNEGLVVIANEYIIGPHALGILEFTIPYKDATFLKTEYIK